MKNKVKNGEIPKVTLAIHTKAGDKPDTIVVLWNEPLGQFEVARNNANGRAADEIRKQLEKETATVAEMGLRQHEQLCRILKKFIIWMVTVIKVFGLIGKNLTPLVVKAAVVILVMVITIADIIMVDMEDIMVRNISLL